MKRLISIIAFFLCMTMAFAKQYQVESVYKKTEFPKGTIGINESGSECRLKYVLVPTELKQGQFKVKLHREKSNLYVDKQTGVYIKTRNCNESRYEIEAVLVVKSNINPNYNNYYNQVELIIPDNQ